MTYFKHENYINIKENDKKDRKLSHVCPTSANAMPEPSALMFRSFTSTGTCK